MGESMGGFGVINQAYYRSNKSDAIVCIAGYGKGSSDFKQNRKTDDIPAVKANPGLQQRLHAFWVDNAYKLKYVPLVVFVHCRDDQMSSFLDQQLLCDAINLAGGNAKMIEILRPRATGRNHHQYYKAAMAAGSETCHTIMDGCLGTVRSSSCSSCRNNIG